MGRLSRAELERYRWLLAVWLAIVLEGAARKWVLPAVLHPVAYLVKDCLAVACVLRFGVKRAKWVSHLELMCAAAIGLCLLPPFLLGLYHFPQGAIATYKNAALWPLFAVAAGSWITPGVARRFTGVLVLTAVGMAVLAGMQFEASPTSWLNRAVWDSESFVGEVATFGDLGGHVRTNGTFSYIAGLTAFASVSSCLLLPLALVEKERRTLAMLSVGLVSSAICGLAAGGRSYLACVLLAAVVALLFGAAHQPLRAAATAIGLLACCAVLFQTSFWSAMNARIEGTSMEYVTERATGSTLGRPFSEMLSDNPFGYGLGLQSTLGEVAAVAAGRAHFGGEYGGEDGRSRSVSEAGIAGLAAMGLAFALLGAAAIRLARRGAGHRITASVTYGVCAAAMAHCCWYDHNLAALWWFGVAIWLGAGSDRVAITREYPGQMVQRDGRGDESTRVRYMEAPVPPTRKRRATPETQAHGSGRAATAEGLGEHRGYRSAW